MFQNLPTNVHRYSTQLSMDRPKVTRLWPFQVLEYARSSVFMDYGPLTSPVLLGRSQSPNETLEMTRYTRAKLIKEQLTHP